MLDGRDTYFADCKTITGVYGVPVNKGFNAAPFVGVNIATENIIASVTLLFDTDTKKFYGYCPLMASDELNNQPVLHEMNDLTGVVNDMALAGIIEAGVVGNACDKCPEGEDLVYLENTKYDPGNGYMGITYAVMSEGSNYKLYGIQMGDALTWYDCSYVIGKAYYGDLSSCTRIAEAEHFAFSSLMNCMYCSVGGTLYRVNRSAETLTSEVQFTHVGETITTLKFHMYRETANQNRSYDLIVASVKSDVGTLRIYEGYNSSGDFKNVKPEVYTGFGPLVDVIYREN